MGLPKDTEILLHLPLGRALGGGCLGADRGRLSPIAWNVAARLRGRPGCARAIAAPSAAGRRPGFPGCRAEAEEAPRRDPRKWGDATKLVRGGLDRSPMARPRKRSSSIPASSMTSRRPPSAALPARTTAMSMAATAIRPSPCSRSGCGCWKVRKPATRVASGMAAVFGALACQLKAGDHLVSSQALFGSCYQIVTAILPRFGIEHDACRRQGSGGLARGHHAGHQVRVPRNALQSDARGHRPCGGLRHRQERSAPMSSSTTSSPPPSCRSR